MAIINGTAANDNLDGTPGDDLIQGLAGDDFLNGSLGSDTLDGGAGYDRANYRNLPVAVVVDMLARTTVKAGGGTDTLIGIERVLGSEFADFITGSGADDDFSGLQGDDTLDGGAGFDNVYYGNATASVQVDLQAGTATGGEGSDTLISIEWVQGSAFDDVIFGSAGDNYFRGLAGSDRIDGRSGFDFVDYRDDPAAVTINLALGQATDGYGGTDTLISIEQAGGSAFDDVMTGDVDLIEMLYGDPLTAVANCLRGMVCAG